MNNTLSAAAVLYAAADLLAPPSTAWGSYSVPCSDPGAHKVERNQVAVLLLAVSFLEMRAQGLLTMDVEEVKKLLVIHTIDVHVHLTPGTQDKLPQEGFNGWLARGFARHDGGKVVDIVSSAYGGLYTDASGVPLSRSFQELLTQGYYEDVTHEAGGVGGFLRKAVHATPKIEHEYTPRCERFQAARREAPRVQALLDTACNGEAHLWEILEKNLKYAIASCTQQQTSSTN